MIPKLMRASVEGPVIFVSRFFIWNDENAGLNTRIILKMSALLSEK